MWLLPDIHRSGASILPDEVQLVLVDPDVNLFHIIRNLRLDFIHDQFVTEGRLKDIGGFDCPRLGLRRGLCLLLHISCRIFRLPASGTDLLLRLDPLNKGLVLYLNRGIQGNVLRSFFQFCLGGICASTR